MKKILLVPMFLMVAISLFVSTGCGGDDEVVEEQSLYERLGGATAVEAAVDQFLVNVLADALIKDDFEGTVANGRAADLRQNLIDQICEASGGPCTYGGLSMADAHANLNINADDFTALVTDLTDALSSLSVGQKEIDELVAILAPLQGDIVRETLLFEAVGGTASVTSVVDTFLTNVVNDPVINGRFAGLSAMDLASLRQNLIDQVSDIMGSKTVTYNGLAMKAAHVGMNITDAEFDALVGDLVSAVNAHNLPAELQARIEAELYPPLLDMRPDIVGQ